MIKKVLKTSLEAGVRVGHPHGKNQDHAERLRATIEKVHGRDQAVEMSTGTGHRGALSGRAGERLAQE